jgi:hypothetical protein
MSQDLLLRELSSGKNIKEIKQTIIREISYHIKKVIIREPVVLVLINEPNPSQIQIDNPVQPEIPNQKEEMEQKPEPEQVVNYNTNASDVTRAGEEQPRFQP